MEIKVSFTEKPLQTGIEEKQFINWEAFLPQIAQFTKLRSYEQVDGIILNDVGMEVILGKKRQRAPKKPKDVNTLPFNDQQNS